MKSIIKKIFEREELQLNPPVLIDIGASETIHKKWKLFSKYAICIAFDADDRDFIVKEEENNNFKKLYTFNCIVSDYDSNSSDFYLTKSPYCSSLLKPNKDGLNKLLFAPLFEIEKIKKTKTVALNSILKQLNINSIDWFKSDSQGVDLRLFKNIDEEIRKKIIVAEFEPGFINAYENEDRLYSILEYMDIMDFWISDFIVKGTPKISHTDFYKLSSNNLYYKFLKESQKIASCWAEITFINNMELNSNFMIREFLLSWLFAEIEHQHTFALTVAKTGYKKFNDPFFLKLEKYSSSLIKKEIYKLKFFPSIITKIKKAL